MSWTTSLANTFSSDWAIYSSGIIAAVVVAGALFLATSKRRGLPLPPSPPGAQWFRGHSIPYEYSFLQISRWVEELGPIITVKQHRQNVVIIGRYQAAVDIMEKQGASSIDRPRSIAAGEILSGGLRLLFTSGGARFKRMRRALHSHLQPKAAESYQPIQLTHVRDMIVHLLDAPDDFQLHAKTYAASVILQISYGKTTPTSALDSEVQGVQRAMDNIRKALQPGAYLVESYPFLKYIPWYASDLKEAHRADTELYMRQLASVKSQTISGDAEPSFSKFLLENQADHSLTEKEMAFLAGGFFTAGSDTTSLGICIILMCAALHPNAQAVVQQEIDAVIGTNRPPTFEDQDSLPQLKAFVSEAMRWRPIIPPGLPHRTTEDIFWGGYCIPAGTTLFGHHWAISRDPETFPNPNTFDPQRWINSEGQFRDDLKFFPYGFGRRTCPGQHIANRSLFITALLVLWSFRLAMWTPPANVLAYSRGFIPHERAFDIKFEPRMDEKELRAVMEGYTDFV